jgi:hypothetical protein
VHDAVAVAMIWRQGTSGCWAMNPSDNPAAASPIT